MKDELNTKMWMVSMDGTGKMIATHISDAGQREIARKRRQ